MYLKFTASTRQVPHKALMGWPDAVSNYHFREPLQALPQWYR